MLPAKSVTSGTETLDFKIKDVISRLQIQLKATNGDSTPDGHPSLMVKQIDIVDGSDVLWSLTGEEAYAVDWYQTGRVPNSLISYIAATQSLATININFGRWIWDSDLAFDPTRFKNPQLKISYDYALGGSSSSSATLAVAADCFNDLKPSPMGWLMTKEYYKYTPSANAYQNIDMPTDYPIRQLMLQGHYGGITPASVYHEIKLSEENDKQVLFDDTTVNLLKQIASEYMWYDERIRFVTTGSDVTHYVTPTFLTTAVGGNLNGEAYVPTFEQSYGGTLACKGTGAAQCDALVKGMLPMGVMAIPFGWLDTPEAWYDVTKLGSLNLRIKAGSDTAGTCQVITEQLRRY
jgi:hypothetical protein